MMKEKTAKLVRKIALSSAKNAVNRKLILILQSPKYLNLSGNTWRKRKSKFREPTCDSV